jgi:hypothetical protein
MAINIVNDNFYGTCNTILKHVMDKQNIRDTSLSYKDFNACIIVLIL